MNIDLGRMRLDVYLHGPDPSPDLTTALDLLTQLVAQGAKLMAAEADLQAGLDKLAVDISARLDALNAQIAALQTQLAAGSPVTQAQLDALTTEVNTIDAALTPPAPPAPPSGSPSAKGRL